MVCSSVGALVVGLVLFLLFTVMDLRGLMQINIYLYVAI